jgi:hypothetical protein
MNFKYAAILNIVFTTMLFGFGLPILFPIAAFSLLIIYLTEIYLLYYSYRAPHMYDEQLSEAVLKLMKWAPLFYLAIGYWMISSRQMNDNDHLIPKQRDGEVMITTHVVGTIFTQRGWNGQKWPMLATFFALLILLISSKLLFKFFKKFPQCVVSKFIDQKLDNYWSTLPESSIEWSIKEEINLRNRLGNARVMLDETLERLQ